MKNHFANLKIYASVISKDLFQVSLVTYLILLLLETVKTGFVSFFLDLNIILWVVLVSGVIMVLTDFGEQKQEIKSSEIAGKVWHYFFKTVREKVDEESSWNFLFKQLHAKHLVENDLKMTPKDWILALRDYEKRQLMKSDLSFLLKEISFRRISERDWFYFSKELKQTTKLTERDLYWMLIVSLGGATLIYYKTQTLGLIALIISILSFFIILLLSYLIFTEQE